MEIGGKLTREQAQCLVEDNVFPAFGFAVEQVAFGHWFAEHFFEAEPLCTKLDFVSPVLFWTAALVLHRPGAISAELHDVSNPVDAQFGTAQGQRAHDPDAIARRAARTVGALVQEPALGRKAVFLPETFDVYQGTLAGTEQNMLQA
jgi:hypothetical protein